MANVKTVQTIPILPVANRLARKLNVEITK